MDKRNRYSAKDYRKLPELDQALSVLAKQLQEEENNKRRAEADRLSREAERLERLSKTPGEMVEFCNQKIRELSVKA